MYQNIIEKQLLETLLIFLENPPFEVIFESEAWIA